MMAKVIHPPFREQPNNSEAELAILGAILVQNDVWRRVSGFLKPEDFYQPVHGRIYAACGAAIAAGRLANDVTLKALFDSDPTAKDQDGARYLARLVRAAATIVNAGEYAHLVHDLALRRRLAQVAQEAADQALDPATALSAAELASQLESRATEVRAAAPSTLQAIRASQWVDQAPEREWLVPGWLPAREINLLSGPGGVGKSLLLQILLTCIATGRPFMGMEVPMPGPCLGLFCEDDEDELHRRQEAINRQLALRPRDLDGLHVISRRGKSNVLMRFDRQTGEGKATGLLHDTLAYSRLHHLRVIGFDTAAQIFGGNENNRQEVTEFLGAGLMRFCVEAGATVVMTAHPSKSAGDQGFSGSTAWEGSVRSRWAFFRPENAVTGDQRTLKIPKANYGKKDLELALCWDRGTLILDPGEHYAEGDRPTRATVFLTLLAELTRQGRHVSPKRMSRTFAPRVMKAMSHRYGYHEADLVAAMEDLLAAKRLKVGTYIGTNRTEVECLEIVGE